MNGDMHLIITADEIGLHADRHGDDRLRCTR